MAQFSSAYKQNIITHNKQADENRYILNIITTFTVLDCVVN